MENHSDKLSSPPSGGDREGATVLEGGIKGEKFKWCTSFLEKRGKELYGERFKIMENDYEIVFKLLVYFIGDKQIAASLNLDLNKGILLTGPIGCGKTSLMTLMRFVPPLAKNCIPNIRDSLGAL